MKTKEIKSRAKESLKQGKTKQETYEELKMMTSTKPEEIAKILNGIPTNELKNKFKVYQILLLGLLGVTVLLKMLATLPLVMAGGSGSVFWIFVTPLVNIALFVGVLLYHKPSYNVVVWLTAIGLLRYSLGLMQTGFEWSNMIDYVLFGGIIALAVYLNKNMFTNYRVVRELYQNNQGQDRMRNIIRFDD